MPSANLLDLLAQLSLVTDELDEPDLDGPDPEEEDLSHAVPEQGTDDLHSYPEESLSSPPGCGASPYRKEQPGKGSTTSKQTSDSHSEDWRPFVPT